MPAIKRIFTSRLSYLRTFFVFAAFALMVLLSYWYVSDIENMHLIRNAENVFVNTQTKIDADLQEPKSMLVGVSETIRSMVLDGEARKLESFFVRLTKLFSDEEIMHGFDGLYGYFYEFGDIDGKGRGLPEGYVATERPWYIAALEANGKIATTHPYVSVGSGEAVITYSRLIFDNSGKPLGVVGLDIKLDRISEYAVKTNVYEGSYGILVDGQLKVIAHPNPDYLGKPVQILNSGGSIVEEIKQGNKITRHKAKDYLGKPAILFVRQLNNGWHMAIITPENKYYENLEKMTKVLIALGLLLAIALSLILQSLLLSKIKTDKLVQSVLDTAPLALTLWNRKIQNVDTNAESLKLFDIPNKKEFLDNFYKLSPEYQPDGQLSSEKIVRIVNKVFEEGSFSFEWMHQKLNGELIPCEVIAIRIKHENDFLAAGYVRDLREVKAANKKIHEAEERMRIMFNAMPLCADYRTQTEIMECNRGAIELFGLANKKEYITRFDELSPKYQPDGRLSKEKADACIAQAFRDGYFRFEWLHQKLDGEPIQCEVTLVKVKYEDDFALAVYIRDLRETYAAMKANERIQAIFEATPLSITMWNPETCKLIDCNTESMRLVGMADKKLFIQKFAEMSPEYQPNGKKSTDMIVDVFTKVMKDGICRYYWNQRDANGEEVPFYVNSVRFEHMGEYSVISYAQDMREVNASQAKAREAEERIKLIFDSTPLAITMWDPVSFSLIDCNLEAVRVVGLTDKKTYIETFAGMSPEYQPNGQKTSDMVVDIFDKTMRDGISRYNWEQKSVDGESIPFSVTTVRLKQMDSYIVISYAQDMREVNASQAKAREAEERMQIMFNSMPLCANFRTRDKGIIDCNEEGMRLFGFESKQEYIKNYSKVYPEYQPDGRLSAEKAKEIVDRGFEEGFLRFEWTYQALNGEVIPSEVTFVRVEYKDGFVLATYIRDLREQKAMIHEMRKAEIAEASNKAKSKFLATMSHEIRTPMNAILGITEIQLQDESLKPHIRDAFSEIYNSGDLLMGIINDILDLTKIEADKMELYPAKYEVASLINDAVHLNMMRNSKPIEFELRVDENVPFLLEGDELRIKQILNNLLSNAYKYTEKGHIKLFIYTEAENPEDENVMLSIRISDTGQGMTDEQVNSLFTTDYSRFNLETNRMIEGTGLGLNIVWRLVNKMNGTISVESEPGKGTVFTVHIPQKRVGTKVLGKKTAENLQKFRISSTSRLKGQNIMREYMPYGKVLIVDDVESNLYVAKGLMIPYGLAIDVASSGFEAINKIKDGQIYDIVFMDHMMPKLDGINATKIMRDLGYRHPVVALTANAVTGQSKLFFDNGFDEFISKPIDIRQLNAVLNKFIRNKQPAEIIADARKQRQKMDESMFHGNEVSKSDPALNTIFLLDIKKALPIIEDTLKNIDNATNEDLHLFAVNVHAIKSALANIGETVASKLAFVLEKAGKEQDKELIKAQTQALIDDILSIKAKIESKNKASDSINEVDQDPGFLREQLQIICNGCADYDERPVNAALEALKKLSWKKETKTLIDKISEQMLYGDFDEVRRLASEVL